MSKQFKVTWKVVKQKRTSGSFLYIHNQSHDVAVRSKGEKGIRAQIPTIHRIGLTPYQLEFWVKFTKHTYSKGRLLIKVHRQPIP